MVDFHCNCILISLCFKALERRFSEVFEIKFRVENEKIISQNVGISEVCDQNGVRVSKNNKSCHICSMRLKSVLAQYEKYGALSMHNFRR